jgi:adenine deaminase
MDDLEKIEPNLVLSDGQLVAEDGHCLVELPEYRFPEEFYHSVHVLPLESDDFVLTTEKSASQARVQVIGCNQVTTRTVKGEQWIPVKDGVLQTEGLIKTAVVYRHGYGEEKKAGKEISLALLSGFPEFHGAIATTYSHDSHNLMIFGTDDGDMALAANELIRIGGGLCAVKDGKVLSEVSLPVAGLLSEEPMEPLTRKFSDFFDAVKEVGLIHHDPMVFLTLMALAVSPEIKCTDIGLVDVLEKKQIPLVIETA